MSPRIAMGRSFCDCMQSWFIYKMRSTRKSSLLGVGCVVVMWLVSHLYRMLLDAYEQSASLNDIEYSWFFRLLLNLLGYSTVLLPMFLSYKYLERTNYFDKITTSTSVLSRALFTCFGEPGERLPETGKSRREEGGVAGAGGAREGAELAFCFTGLMGSYLVWGLLQEKIMTTKYALSDGSTLRFTDSQFLVFVNRLTALLVAGARLTCTQGGGGGGLAQAAPLYRLSYCALTNVLSAWCQYEALKYVSFPTQVLSKSCKVLPVMLMGKLVSRNKYEPYEYVTAALISAGMVMFMFGSHDHDVVSSATTASGLCLLAMYMVCDSFTSSWQGAVFARTGCGPLQMLCGVNLFSIALTAAAHPFSATSLTLLTHPVFVADCAVLSLSSTLGQLFIYRTIARFGAVVFTIIMTLRQAVSILLSCFVYGHRVSAGGAAGVCAVFAAVLLRLYCRQRTRRARTARAARAAHAHTPARGPPL